MSNLMSVDEALARILAQFKPLDMERVPLLASLDRVLAEDIVADINIPPFDNSAMDGYAIIAADTETVPATLRVIGNIAAGETANAVRVTHGTAVRIMTGAPLPMGADAVARFEQTSEGTAVQLLSQQRAQTRGDSVQVFVTHQTGDNVRRAGEDVVCGQTVIKAGAVIRPQEIGLLAALGRAQVPVHRKPRVAILATGDELVGIEEPLTAGKIRNVNEWSTAALVLRYGGEPLCLGIARDTLEHLRAKVQEGLAQSPDLFLTSAGVSVGDFDMVKDVLAMEGHIEFWSIAIKPGKPMAFGRVQDVPLVGLPGNPVAAMVAFEQFVRPAILKMAGHTNLRKPTIKAICQETIESSGRRHFMRAIVTKHNDKYHVRTTGEQGSGVLTSMVRANAFLVIPEGVMRVNAGEVVEAQMLDWQIE
jgi:molybdopterin molybdotransferase